MTTLDKVKDALDDYEVSRNPINNEISFIGFGDQIREQRGSWGFAAYREFRVYDTANPGEVLVRDMRENTEECMTVSEFRDLV